MEVAAELLQGPIRCRERAQQVELKSGELREVCIKYVNMEKWRVSKMILNKSELIPYCLFALLPNYLIALLSYCLIASSRAELRMLNINRCRRCILLSSKVVFIFTFISCLSYLYFYCFLPVATISVQLYESRNVFLKFLSF